MQIEKALLILANPDSDDSRSNLVTEACRNLGEHLQLNSINVDLIDVYKDMEDGEMESVYYPDKSPVKAVEYQVRIKKADLIIVMFPVWLYTMPSVLKTFLEYTFTDDLLYERSKQKFLPALSNKKFKIFAFDNDPKWKSQMLFRDGLELIWTRGILSESGASSDFKLIHSLEKFNEKIGDNAIKSVLKDIDKMIRKNNSLIDLID